METLQILGWIYLGIILGCMGGVIGLGLFQVNRVADLRATIKDLQDELDDLNFKNKILKGENKRLSKRGKPMPRKKRTWKRKTTKK